MCKLSCGEFVCSCVNYTSWLWDSMWVCGCKVDALSFYLPSGLLFRPQEGNISLPNCFSHIFCHDSCIFVISIYLFFFKWDIVARSIQYPRSMMSFTVNLVVLQVLKNDTCDWSVFYSNLVQCVWRNSKPGMSWACVHVHTPSTRSKHWLKPIPENRKGKKNAVVFKNKRL